MTRVAVVMLALLSPCAACAGARGDASNAPASGDKVALPGRAGRDGGAPQADASLGDRGDGIRRADAHADAGSVGFDAHGEAERRDARAVDGDSARSPDASHGEGVTEPHATAAAHPCPNDMVLVDGEYCETLEMSCLRSTYAAQNQKTICWDFREPTVCTGRKTHKRYCIDRYEYPNQKGVRPRVMVNFPQAQALCADEGKRVCTETEWTMACEGPAYKPYPYGYHRDPNICRGDQPYPFPDLSRAFSKDRHVAATELARTYAGVPSGSQPRCVSDYGVYDMPGNADELASSETPPPRSPYDNVTTGGPWLDGVRNQCRPKIYTHNEGFAYYYLSFRCCAESDAVATDPRSPKQIERGERWRRVVVPPQISPPLEPR